MQTALKIFEVLPLGAKPFEGMQKIAVKLPAKAGAVSEQDAAGFLEIMSALLSIQPDRLQASLKRLGWVPLEGEPEGAAPLIDLSDSKNKERVMSELLDLMLPQPAISTAKTGGWGDLSEFVGSQVPQTGDQTTASILAAVLRNARTKLQPAAFKAESTEPSGEKTLPDTGELFLPRGIELSTAKTPTVEKGKASTTPPRQTATEIQSALQEVLAEQKAPVFESQDRLTPKADDKAKAQAPKLTQAMRPMMPTAAAGNETQAQDSAKKVDPAPPKLVPENIADDLVQTMALDKEEGDETGTDQKSLLSRHSVRPDMGHGPSATDQNDTGSSAAMSKAPPVPQQLQHDVIRQIVQRMTLRSDALQSHMQIRLKPEFLGDLHLQISTENHQVMIRMTTDSVAVKEMIQQHLVHLRNELQQHGLVIDKFDVFVGHEDDGWKNAQQQAAFGQERQRRQQRSRMGASAQVQASATLAPETLQNKSTLYGSAAEVDFFA